MESIRGLVNDGATHITFGDPDFLNGPGHSFRIVRAMHAEFPDLTFDFTAKVEHLLKHRTLLPKFAEAGCLFVISAFESLSDVVLANLDKGHTRENLYSLHHLQYFMTARYRPYRGLFGTPFWTEGNALYWELLFWDLKFPKTPENRVGMLFWRMHRCARIIFSLSFHLEKMMPQECIDFLVNRVGHERDNATAEVRRSFDGSYGPLYQIAYLIGGLQQYSLHRDLVDSGKMTNRQFNDALLRQNRIPIVVEGFNQRYW